MKTNNQHKTEIINRECHSIKVRGMPIFKCSCGANILIVPNLPEMDKAIQAHIIEHKRITGQQLKEEIIIEMILKAITEY